MTEGCVLTEEGEVITEATLPTGYSLRPANQSDTKNMFDWEMDSIDTHIRDDKKVISYIEKDVQEVVLELGAQMIRLARKGDSIEENKRKMLENIQNGKALEKFKQLVKKQNGDISYLENPEKFEKAKYIIPVICEKDGFVADINAEQIGRLSVFLGAGRIKKEDKIDKTVGIVLEKKVGDKVAIGDVLAYIHANEEKKAKEAVEQLKEIYAIGEKEIGAKKAIIKII